MFKRLHQRMSVLSKILQRFVERPWYPLVLGLLAAVDNFVVVIPTDGLLISSSMVTPRKWFWLALWVSIGSAVGAYFLAGIIEFYGLPWVELQFPFLMKTSIWSLTVEFFDRYGLWVVLFVAMSPLLQLPAIVMATTSSTPITEIVLIVFLGRMIKYTLYSYLGSHTPRILGRIWGLKAELEDAGVKID